MFSIHSVSSDRELQFHSLQGDEFMVELQGLSPSALLRVSAYTDAFGLNRLFQELAQLEKPWQGIKSWESLEGEFSLSSTCSLLGNVTFRVILIGLMGASEEWRLEAGLNIDFGMLQEIGKKSDAFFNAGRI